jgi:hypothetical protein
MSDTVVIISGIVSATAAVLALVGSLYAWRTRELRREEVLHWAMECIEVLQTSLIIFQAIRDKNPNADTTESRKLQIRSSVLCEQGRLFFKNQSPSTYGQHKRPAFQGLRPIILDRLLVNYQLFDKLAKGDNSNIVSMARIAEDNLKHFVSLTQAEVGRERAASADASLGGQSISMDQLILDDIQRRS